MNQVFDAYATYYDLLYRDKDYAREAAYVLELLSDQGVEGGSILELGSGTGRHALHLAQAGFSVDGYDISETMVASANLLVSAHAPVCFDVGDARTLRLGRKYDAVVALFHVASYQTRNEDLLAMFSTAAMHLKPGGAFIFDFWHGPGVLSDLPEARQKQLEDDHYRIQRAANPVLQTRRNVVDVHYEVSVTSKLSQQQSTINEVHSMRYLFEPELDLLLGNCSLHRAATFAFMTKDEPTSRTWQAIAIARPGTCTTGGR